MLAVAAFCFASFFATWFATRERTAPNQATAATSGQQASGSQATATAAALDAARSQAARGSAAPGAALPQHAEVLVTPLFDASTRLEALQPSKLRFRARRVGSGEPATGVDLSVSVVQAPGLPQLPLPVRDLGGGVYEAEFVPPTPGEFTALLAARGQPPRSVRLSVLGEPDEAVDAAGSTGAFSAGAGHRGAGHASAHRGR
jgi:hypothetical protein